MWSAKRKVLPVTAKPLPRRRPHRYGVLRTPGKTLRLALHMGAAARPFSDTLLALAPARLGALDERVGRPFGVEHFFGAFGAGYRPGFYVDQSDLHQHRRLVPIDVL